MKLGLRLLSIGHANDVTSPPRRTRKITFNVICIYICRFTLHTSNRKLCGANYGFLPKLEKWRGKKETRTQPRWCEMCTLYTCAEPGKTTANNTIHGIDKLKHDMEISMPEKSERTKQQNRVRRTMVRHHIPTHISNEWNKICSLVVTFGSFRPKRLHH